MATVITPNIPEAKLLVQRNKDPDPETQEEMVELAKNLHKLGPKYVLVKGGHFQSREKRSKGSGHKMADILFDGQQAVVIEKEYIDRKNTHGTGCSLACTRIIPNLHQILLIQSAAIACNLTLGCEVEDAVRKACRYVEAGIRTSIDRGKGSGPINHFHSSYSLPFTP